MEKKKTGVKGFVPMMDKKFLKVRIVGLSPLLVHAWAQKALIDILAKQRKHPKGGHDKREPLVEYEASKYLDINGDDAILASAVKNAMVTACTSEASMKKVMARQAFFVFGVEDMERPKIIFDKENDGKMRDDMVRLSGSGSKADVRFRPCYYNWQADVVIEYNAKVISRDQTLNLLALAGDAVGIFEWRPEKNGDYGRFEIGDIEDLEERPKWDRSSLYLRKKDISVWGAIQALEANVGVSGMAALNAKNQEEE